ncbi:DUF2752 domain-containing protein [Lentimicrobium sp. S6]|nr:DUF2752 domain-containing protein [Lentimicrobium sp. S6]NPD45762.1 DUF2752 domain-containing protein [Lentimicrobium sp. S6]
MAGYIWLGLQTYLPSDKVGLCLIKQSTNIPCPSCGTSRSILSICKGEFSQALQWNPLGYISLFITLISPFWILLDWVSNKTTFFKAYKNIEIQLKKPIIYIPSIILVLANWIWNILKGL